VVVFQGVLWWFFFIPFVLFMGSLFRGVHICFGHGRFSVRFVGYVFTLPCNSGWLVFRREVVDQWWFYGEAFAMVRGYHGVVVMW